MRWRRRVDIPESHAALILEFDDCGDAARSDLAEHAALSLLHSSLKICCHGGILTERQHQGQTESIGCLGCLGFRTLSRGDKIFRDRALHVPYQREQQFGVLLQVLQNRHNLLLRLLVDLKVQLRSYLRVSSL